MPWLNVVLFLYGILDIVMGYLGYTNKGSIMSLVAGGLSGVIILSTLAWYKLNQRAARITALVVTVLMLGRFAPKAFENQLYPAGIMFIASLAVTICLVGGHIAGMKAKKARAGETK